MFLLCSSVRAGVWWKDHVFSFHPPGPSTGKYRGKNYCCVCELVSSLKIKVDLGFNPCPTIYHDFLTNADFNSELLWHKKSNNLWAFHSLPFYPNLRIDVMIVYLIMFLFLFCFVLFFCFCFCFFMPAGFFFKNQMLAFSGKTRHDWFQVWLVWYILYVESSLKHSEWKFISSKKF